MNITKFLLARIAEDEAVARATMENVEYRCSPEEGLLVRRGSSCCDCGAGGYVEYGPDRLLAECAAKRVIVAVVNDWEHDYNEADPWYSCGLAMDHSMFAHDRSPGGGCWDDGKRGNCQCGLENHQLQILAPLATVYESHPDYDQEWRP
jgi:hypothetical protein